MTALIYIAIGFFTQRVLSNPTLRDNAARIYKDIAESVKDGIAAAKDQINKDK